MSTALERVQECYKTMTTAFGAGGSFYDGTGHRGADYRSYDGEAIIAYDDMRIESIDYGSGLGQSLGVRCLTLGGFAGWAHVKGIRGRVGDVIPYGQTLAYTAGWGDAHGSLWTGPHIHTTRGFVSAFNCSVGIRPLVDPVPDINAAKAGTTTAAINQRPVVVTPPPPPPPVGGNMFLIFDQDAQRAAEDVQYVLVTVDGGQFRGVYLEDPFYRAVVLAARPQIPIAPCDAGTFSGFLERIGYEYQKPVPLLEVSASGATAEVDEAALAEELVAAGIAGATPEQVSEVVRAVLQTLTFKATQ